jgi:hypothetical protein
LARGTELLPPNRDSDMRVKIQFTDCLPLLLVCLILAVMIGCGQRPAYVGTYLADIDDSPNHQETTLELKETGVGVWKVGDNEVAFSWYAKNNELRLNTKNGGVIVADIDNGVIHCTLPGSKDLRFRKVK